MSRANQQGFTLQELMITLAIVGIITAVAVPSLQKSLVKSRRADGQTALMEIMQMQERYQSMNNSYASNLADLGLTTESGGEFISSEEYYQVNATACGSGIATCVLLTATPRGTQSDAGEVSLSYNSLGVKTPAGKW